MGYYIAETLRALGCSAVIGVTWIPIVGWLVIPLWNNGQNVLGVVVLLAGLVFVTLPAVAVYTRYVP